MSHHGSDQYIEPEAYELEESGSEESESESESEVEAEPEPEPLGPKLPIHFNIRMQPIGDGSTKFSSFVGKTARIHCSPIYSDWQSVPDQMKKHVWKTVSDQQSSPPNGHSAVPSSTRCIVKSFRKRNIALGNVRMDTSPSIDSYNVIIDDIFDHGADLYEGEGTFEDVVLGRTIKWPRILVQML